MSPGRSPVSVVTICAAVVLAVVHMTMLLGIADLLMRVAPAMQQRYADFGLRLPFVTDRTIRAADVMRDSPGLAGLCGVTILVADVGAFVLLASHRRTRILAAAWAVAVT